MSLSVAAVFVATGMRLVASHEPAFPGRPFGPVGYADGAPPGFSGGFKEDSCHACHFHENLNAAPGRMTIEGAPEKFAPGETYMLTITLMRAQMQRAGFQLAARFTSTGAQAGTLAPDSADAERVKIENSGGIQYAGHKLAGSKITDAGRTRWVVQWTAPSSGDAVMFNVAANAADGDERVDGDFIYTAKVEASPSR